MIGQYLKYIILKNMESEGAKKLNIKKIIFKVGQMNS